MSIEITDMLYIVSWLSFTVLASIFGYVSIRWVINLIWPVRYVTVNHFHDGELVASNKLDLESATPLVRQLKEIERQRSHG